MTLEAKVSKTKLIPLSISPPYDISDMKLIIKERGKIQFIHKTEIEYCESDSNYCIIHLQSGKKMIISKCLKQVSNDLTTPNFKRIHSKYLINLAFLDQIDISNKKVTMSNGAALPISRARYKDLLATIN